MSHSPSQKPPTASPGAPSDPLTQSDQALIDASRRLSDLGLFGLISLDRDLRVVSAIGGLVGFIAVGKPLAESLPAIVGLECDILGLHENSDRAIELPAIAIATDAGTHDKLNVTFFWSAARSAPAALVLKSSAEAAIEVDLIKQVRARLMAEAAVTAKSKELARANADLESFAEIVSHDLKAPLRHMRHLIEKVCAEIETGNTSAIREALESIDTQAHRMSAMLSALLDYSTMGRKYEAIEPVDTRAIVEEICASLPRSAHTIAIIGHWPTIDTLRAPLDLVLRNLIANALKHHDRRHGTVSISCQDQEIALAISVADDGPGIAPCHHQAIFLPFRTLRPHDPETAAGMGLAAAMKAVSAVHGTIEVRSDPASARGTTFTITWPKAIAD